MKFVDEYDILQGVYLCIRQLEEGRAEVENQYARVVALDGNRHAREIVREVFQVVPRRGRGMGEITRSGLVLSERYAALDAERRLHLQEQIVQESPECIAGLILQGIKKPHDCPVFGTACTPERPLAAPMVSSEGACAAYYRYRRLSLGRANSPLPR